MLRIRKLLANLLGLLLIILLLLIAVSLNIKSNLLNVNKFNNWIDYSSAYSSLINKITDESNNLLGNQYQVQNIKPIIKNAAEKAYPESEFKQNIKKILTANVNWVNGITPQPEFNINLINYKNDFAKQIANFYLSQIEILPLCSQLQEAELNTSLSVNCWPPNLSPSVGAKSIENQIDSSSIFLNIKNLNAENIKFNNSENHSPYYLKINNIIKKYQLVQKLLPYLLILIALVALSIIYLHPRKRKGFRIIGYAFSLSGIIVILSKIALKSASSKLTNKIFNNSSVVDFRTPITKVIDSATFAINKTFFLYGTIYLIIGLIILIFCLFYILKQRKVRNNNGGTPGSGTKEHLILPTSTINLSN